MIYKTLVLFIFLGLLCVPSTYAQQYSSSSRQTGEAVLDELLIGEDVLIVKTGSNGCTGKNSFRIDIQKGQGLDPKVPHYLLTINRVNSDECKAIVYDGVLIVWDLRKDLGLKDNFTFSVKNMVYSVIAGRKFRIAGEDSLVSIINKHFAITGTEQKKGEDTRP
jgi:hypothetical protein